MFCITWCFDRLRGHCTGVAEPECSFDHDGACVPAADGVDPKQGATVPTGEYTDALGIDAADVTVGVLEEGFGHEQSEADVDVLAMPTTPQTAHEHDPRLSRVEAIDRALNMLPTTAPFENTGYPAISVLAGTDDGLLVRTMFVGDAFDDKTVLGVADAFWGCVESGI